MKRHNLLGEVAGTFLLVFFGCGSLASAITSNAFVGIAQIAFVWGFGIAIAIYVTGGLSGAHLNPAVTLGFCVARRFSPRAVIAHVGAQCLGSFLACLALYGIFHDPIASFEKREGLLRGLAGSERSAMIFTEFYPNPSAVELLGAVTMTTAFLAEALGTFVLMLVILALTDTNNPSRTKEGTALVIGFTVAILICLLGPISMAGFNPARDFVPRVFAYLFGWGSLVFDFNGYGYLTVYIIAPICGAVVAALLYRYLFAPHYTFVSSRTTP